MSRDNLSNLLDSMLEESSTSIEASEQAQREARERAEREKRAAELRDRSNEQKAKPTFSNIEEITGLVEADLRAVLAKAPPDDLLIVLATANDAFQRRLLSNLSADSVKWLRDNLAHIDEVTRAEREGAQKKVLKAANQLLAEGKIGLPEPESIGASEAPDASDKDLRELLTELVKIAAQSGPDALTEVLAGSGEPLLAEGLALIKAGKKGGELRTALGDHRAKLEAHYAQRLLWMADALEAIAHGEKPESFRARLFESG